MLLFFFFNDTATTEIYTLSLHDALPISPGHRANILGPRVTSVGIAVVRGRSEEHRLNSSHSQISYAVFCLKKKKFSPSPNTPRRRARSSHTDRVSPRTKSPTSAELSVRP